MMQRLNQGRAKCRRAWERNKTSFLPVWVFVLRTVEGW